MTYIHVNHNLNNMIYIHVNHNLNKMTYIHVNHNLNNMTYILIKPLYIYVSRIGPISGHMTLTIATFPSTTPKFHRAR